MLAKGHHVNLCGNVLLLTCGRTDQRPATELVLYTLHPKKCKREWQYDENGVAYYTERRPGEDLGRRESRGTDQLVWWRPWCAAACWSSWCRRSSRPTVESPAISAFSRPPDQSVNIWSSLYCQNRGLNNSQFEKCNTKLTSCQSYHVNEDCTLLDHVPVMPPSDAYKTI